MDTIVNKISEIETAAVKIMNESALQKKELDEESKQRMDAYDADVDKKTEAKLADIRASLENQKKAELSSLKEAAARTIMTLEKEYSEIMRHWCRHIKTDDRGISYGKTVILQWNDHKDPCHQEPSPYPEGLRDAGRHADGHRRAGLSETEALL